MRALRAFGRALLAFVAVLGVLGWVEAEKEARILCRMSKTGSAAAEVDRLFGTAKLMRVLTDGGAIDRPSRRELRQPATLRVHAHDSSAEL